MGAAMTDEQILVDLPLPIETPRLILRPAMPGDGAETAQAVEETWDDLRQWMDWATVLPDVEECEIRARKNYADFLLREDFNFRGIEKSSGRIVVWSGLHVIDWPSRKFYTGYWVRESAQGRGYAAEVCNAVVRYAFAVLGARRVEITHSEGNEASRHIVSKLGFEKEGVRRAGMLLPDGRQVDSHVYSMLSPDRLPPLDVRWGLP
jgi:RimJ/RimL family protein N-acetyltransferase